MLLLFYVMAVAAGAASALVSRRITAAAGRGTLAALVLLRGLGLAALCLLVWKAFRGREEVTLRSPHQAGAAGVIVLQDRSASMDLIGSPGRTREDLSSVIWQEVQERLRRSGGPGMFSIQRFLFAENLVEDSPDAPLLRDGSRLSRAFTEILSRKDLRALLLISDGATTDGLAPPYFIDWARNRNIRLSAICAAVPDLGVFDQAIQEVLCETENPTSLTAKVRSWGEGSAPVTVRLSIDGSRLPDVQRARGAFLEVPLRLPLLEKGWHTYTVEVKPLPNEATELNNVCHGTFRIDRSGIFFIQDRPRMEDVHLIRFLRKELGDALRLLSPEALLEPGTAQGSRDASAVFLADVAVEKIPAAVRDRWTSAGIPLVLLGGESLDAWAALGIPGFPVTRGGAVGPAGPEDGPAAKVTPGSPAASLEVFRQAEVDLEVDLIQEAQVRRDAAEVFRVKAARGILPLLVSDSLDAPRLVVLLTDATWKWARDPRDRTRRDYEVFWSACLKWLRKGERERAPLRIKLQPLERSDEELRGWVEAAGGRRGRDLADCRVSVEGGALVAPAEAADDPDRPTFRIRRDQLKVQSGVFWIQAFAALDGKEVSSERVPVAMNRSLKELRSIAMDPEVLRRHTTGESDAFSWFPDRGPVIDSLFREDPVQAGELKEKRRKSTWELALALMAFLFLAVEWRLERTLRAESRS